jgi:hypothetical protein
MPIQVIEPPETGMGLLAKSIDAGMQPTLQLMAQQNAQRIALKAQLELLEQEAAYQQKLLKLAHQQELQRMVHQQQLQDEAYKKAADSSSVVGICTLVIFIVVIIVGFKLIKTNKNNS